VATLAAYVFAGNLVITRIAGLNGQYAALDTAVETAKPADGECRRLCEVGGRTQVSPSPRVMHLCDAQFDLGRQLRDGYRDLNRWAGLGVLSGLAIGFFLSPTPTAAQGAAGVGMVVNLTAPALGFIAGHAVDVLFLKTMASPGAALAVERELVGR